MVKILKNYYYVSSVYHLFYTCWYILLIRTGDEALNWTISEFIMGTFLYEYSHVFAILHIALTFFCYKWLYRAKENLSAFEKFLIYLGISIFIVIVASLVLYLLKII